METAGELLKQGRRRDIWTKYCGFLDLTLPEVMDIQRRLLLEQLQLLGSSAIGKEIMGGKTPQTVEEFRETVPLTKYKDYAHYLLEKDESVLPEMPYCWVRTSGRSGEYRFKWVPYTYRFWYRTGQYAIAALLIGSSRKKGEIVLELGDKVLFTLAPQPYMSGEIMVKAVLAHFPFEFLPPPEVAEKMDFFERIQLGLEMSMEKDLNIFYGLASLLVAVGKRFEEGTGRSSIKPLTLLVRPRALARIVKGLVKSRLQKRALLPRDLWQPKVMILGGMDSAIFRDQVEYYWGENTMEGYGFSEGGGMSYETWGRKGQAIIPDLNFMEFIPYKEYLKEKEDPAHKPRTLLLDELKPGEIYEVVITNFLGGTFIRYRVGDLIRITAMGDPEHNIDLPHLEFYSRADDVIDLAGFTRLTESSIWKAIANSGVPYTDWAARKEYRDDRPLLKLLLETPGQDAAEIREKIVQAMMNLDSDYRDMVEMLGGSLLELEILPPGAFQYYMEEMQRRGADLAHLKPPRINPSPEMIAILRRSD